MAERDEGVMRIFSTQEAIEKEEDCEAMQTVSCVVSNRMIFCPSSLSTAARALKRLAPRLRKESAVVVLHRGIARVFTIPEFGQLGTARSSHRDPSVNGRQDV